MINETKVEKHLLRYKPIILHLWISGFKQELSV